MLNRGRAALGSEGSQAQLTLRVCEVEGPEFSCGPFFDIGLPDGASAWTFEVGLSDRSWLVQIGLKTPSGKFHLLIQSNIVRTPPDHASAQIDEQWGWLPLPSVEPGASSSSR